ncbi:PIG-L family deacetylase [Psychrobacter sp.]|uniref:PIG-L deacetylase family protein n=1 Tax=Psychrobacter sp. TaxID=56811 RepID=UPI0025D903BA|nr:PIG-L family deacetylase [Psychrobacter sp.]
MAVVNSNHPSPTKIHPIVGDRVIEGDGTSTEAWQNWQGLQDLPRLNIGTSFSTNSSKLPRVCVFAPHPDDEILGCAGLIQQLTLNGNPILIVHVTNGSQSHPESEIYPPSKLDIIRPNESVEAFKKLGVDQQVTISALNLQDGQVYHQQDLFHQKLTEILEPTDILVTPFIHDGHPDHEATGQVVAAYAKQHNLKCYQVLIWAWHWARPADSRVPWQNALRIDLTAEQQQRKVDAIHCFKSQITMDESTGNPPILSAQTINRISQPWEVYI